MQSQGQLETITSYCPPRADFTGWKSDDDKFNEQLELVIKALRADADARETPPRRKL